jgi:hypothetical protein
MHMKNHWLTGALAVFVVCIAGCGKKAGPQERVQGQTEFTSAPPLTGGAAKGAAGAPAAGSAGAAPAAASASAAPDRKVEETDLYRLEGDRLYFLNGYRGLMVFDVSDVDHPRLLGRSPIFGWPVEMIVRNGVATVVVADWYGSLEDGTPFHGSVVRGLDATDPAQIKLLGEAKLGGWVRDTRVVGDVLYAVSVDYGWVYGWDADVSVGAVSPGYARQTLAVSSVSFGGGTIKAVGQETFPGYGGVFNVTPRSILLAHDAAAASPGPAVDGKTELLYLDISDPGGGIVKRGSLSVKGRVEGWGADNGRWNLDFADGKIAHMVGCGGGYYWGCSGQNGYLLETVDFSNPDAPVLLPELGIPSSGWGVAARFDTNRLYLSPESYSSSSGSTPFQVYDLTEPAAPKLAGTAQIPGTVWNILPAPNQRIFALGNDWTGVSGTSVSLKYLDVSNPASPKLLGTSTFGEGWAWTPAAGTFKAFTMDATKGLVVLPFSGWSYSSATYNNGLQLIEFTDLSERTAGAAKTRGWAERGIFVKTRLVSLSNLALSVVDYTDHVQPKVISELTLARNVVTALPQGPTLTEISSDWWDNDVSTSEVRILPIENAEESLDASGVPTLKVEGVNARVFRNTNLAYVVTDVRVPTACPAGSPSQLQCQSRAQQVQVVDLTNGQAVPRGKVRLPADDWAYGGRGWAGCFWYDWYDGAEVVQVQGDALAFRRWQRAYAATGGSFLTNSALYVVDLANADAPSIASVTLLSDPDAWWGNMKVVGNTLYATHYEWYQRKLNDPTSWTVKYYLDRIDLSDRNHPVVGSKINVPGLLIGGSEKDPSILYTVDYRWNGTDSTNDIDVIRVDAQKAELISTLTVDGWVGQSFIRGDKVYLSAQRYDQTFRAHVTLHEIDLSKPAAPVDRPASSQRGWGWLLGVEGDRAIVTSGWGLNGVDIYVLADGQVPHFSQFVRTRGWWANGVSRQNDSLFLASGYWGVQRIQLK